MSNPSQAWGSVEIRELAPPDAGAFQALRLEGLVECPSAFASSHEEEIETPIAAVAERLAGAADRCVIGAFQGRDLVGIVGLERMRKKKLAHKAHIWGMYVAPHARRRRVGHALVVRALERAASMRGVLQVTLGVNASNRPALALYEALGFEPFGLERGFLLLDGVLHDEIHMARVFP